jgi:ferredoxin
MLTQSRPRRWISAIYVLTASILKRLEAISMKVVKFLAQVDETKCIGDKLCETVCPAGAIKVAGKKAAVDEKRCVACSNCSDICREEAVTLASRFEPVLLGLNPEQVDQNELTQLCARAHLHPRQLICLCTATLVSEVAAAVLKGAGSPEEITLMTGVCSGCTVYCMEPMLRLLKANGVEPPLPKGRRLYNITPTLWDVPPEVVRKYPGYYLTEDKDVFRKI